MNLTKNNRLFLGAALVAVMATGFLLNFDFRGEITNKNCTVADFEDLFNRGRDLQGLPHIEMSEDEFVVAGIGMLHGVKPNGRTRPLVSYNALKEEIDWITKRMENTSDTFEMAQRLWQQNKLRDTWNEVYR